MENTDDEYSFDLTPKLKSSPIKILFVSFNESDKKCIYCGEEYIKTIFCRQKYCKKCASCYITDIKYNNIYLDLNLYIENLKCCENERSETYEPQNIQECCRNCLEILYFKQIPVRYSYKSKYRNLYENTIESEKNCRLCGKSLYKGKNINEMERFKLCSNCYLISSGCVKSTLTEKSIPIIYLPWWHNKSYCEACKKTLTFISDCQKYCTNCLIFYTGCRYCLTTNVIFGPTIQSQCKKCKRVSSIDFDNTKISIGNSDLDDFLSNSRINIYESLKITEFVDKVKNIDKYFCPYTICKSIYQVVKQSMEWISYSQFTNINEIAQGGYGTIYQATWLDGGLSDRGYRSSNETVILKRFMNSKDIDKYFLNELKSNQYCYQIKHHIVKTYGFTRDPELEGYILVMEYAKEGDLHNFLQKRFADITWNKEKLIILWQISEGLETIHKANYIHRDFHSGNILFDFASPGYEPNYDEKHQWKIGDLGLSQHANNTSSNNEIYGVIPYIAPEIFNGCWDPDPKKRPSIKKVRNTFGSWYFRKKHNEVFDQAESKRKKLINLRQLGPEFSEKPHPDAIFTSRPLSSIISKCSSINPSKDYTSKELEFDIDIERSNVVRTIEELNINSHAIDYTSKELEFDIDIERSNVVRTIEELNINSHAIDYTSKELEFDIDIERANVLVTKRNIEELNINSHENNGKHIKIE
ncbi:kinase-like domain-containing protein [Rhizophagus irregularis DAOM 181602=DAOM 197198]|nr:kinase-like domain-containing protein [Rhizophagus irregularis DAOM 181602=DAOM 197198]